MDVASIRGHVSYGLMADGLGQAAPKDSLSVPGLFCKSRGGSWGWRMTGRSREVHMSARAREKTDRARAFSPWAWCGPWCCWAARVRLGHAVKLGRLLC